MARQKAVRAGAKEALMVRNGILVEGAASNVFVVRAGRISTHPADGTILRGISRDIAIELAGEVHEEAVPLEAALAADEIFLTGTTTEVTGVVELDGRPVGAGTPGPVTLRLGDAYEALWRRECPPTPSPRS
jgi:D-alanine transaminase